MSSALQFVVFERLGVGKLVAVPEVFDFQVSLRAFFGDTSAESVVFIVPHLATVGADADKLIAGIPTVVDGFLPKSVLDFSFFKQSARVVVAVIIVVDAVEFVAFFCADKRLYFLSHLQNGSEI